jgi:hypothetical protein
MSNTIKSGKIYKTIVNENTARKETRKRLIFFKIDKNNKKTLFSFYFKEYENIFTNQEEFFEYIEKNGFREVSDENEIEFAKVLFETMQEFNERT